MAAKNIKIPAKHYVGMVNRQNEKIPLGFITPWGDDAGAKNVWQLSMLGPSKVTTVTHCLL